MTDLPQKKRRRRRRPSTKVPEVVPVTDPVLVKARLDALVARWTAPCISLFLLGALLLVLGQTIGDEFVNIGDDASAYGNTLVTSGLTPGGIFHAFGPAHAGGGFYAPLATISHMLDWQLFHSEFSSEWAGGHHLTNILLHAISVLLLFLALRRMTGAVWRSAFVAAVFAIHPAQVESVAWVSERTSLLGGLFFMLVIGAYVRLVRGPWSPARYAGMIVLFALGLLASPALVALPFVLLLLDYWPLGRFAPPVFADEGQPREPNPFPAPVRLLIEKIPLLALSCLAYAAAVYAWVKTRNPLDTFAFHSQVSNALVSYVTCLGRTLYPADLTVFYPHLPAPSLNRGLLIALFLLAVISAGVFLLRKNRPYLVVGWLWYLGMLAPAIGWGAGGLFAGSDRFGYLPRIGLYVIAAWGAWDLCASLPRRAWFAGAAMAIAIAALVPAAETQASWWRDSESLWTHAIDSTRDNYIAYNHLGLALIQKGHMDEAISNFHKAVEIRPDYAEAHYNAGTVLFQQGNVDGAITHYRDALQIRPDYPEADLHLGIALVHDNMPDNAIGFFKKALEARPGYEEAHFNLGIALAATGKPDEAITHYQKAIEIRPNYAEAYYYLGVAYVQKGDFQKAIPCYKKALEIRPNYAEAYYNLGVAFFQSQDLEDAIANWQKTVDIQGTYEEAQYNLGFALALKGRWDDAIFHYRKALEIGPNYAEIYNNLGNIYLQEKQFGEAIDNFEKALEIAPQYLLVRNNLAWLRATCSNALFRNGAKAVELIQETSRLAGDKDPALLRTLAAAYAESGNFPDAVKTARQALEHCDNKSDAPLAKALLQDLKLYEAGTPYHEMP